MAGVFDPAIFDSDVFDVDGGGLTRTATDTTSVTDAPAASGTYTRAVGDTTSVTELVTHQSSGGTAFSRPVVDTTTLTEAPQRTRDAPRALSESLTVTESVERARGVLRSLSDTVTGTDALAQSYAGTRGPIENIPTTAVPMHLSVETVDPDADIASGYLPVLAQPIDADDTTVFVTNPPPDGHDVPFVVVIGGERLLVTDTGVDGTTWTVVRGHDGSTASAHAALSVARPGLVSVRIEGVEYAGDVDFRHSSFSTYANGNPGACEIWIRVLDGAEPAIETGSEIIVRFRGIKMWGGFVMAVRRSYVFASGSGRGSAEYRYLVLEGADYNILMRKRIYFDPSDPNKMHVRRWPAGTWDSVVLSQIVNSYLDLTGDRLSFDIQHVGTPMLPTVSCNPDAPDRFSAGSAGYTWEEVMAAIASQIGSIYYIDPDRTFRYVDDATRQSAFGWAGVSDAPNGTSTLGYRDFEITRDGTKLVNEQWTWGAGQGSAHLVLGHYRDEASITEHGLWQGAELRYDMYCQESVDLRAETWVEGSPQNHRGHDQDKILTRFTVFEPYFRVGDVIGVECTSFGFNRSLGVRGAEITFPTPWDIQMVLTASHEIDAPWSAYEFWFPRFGGNFPFPDFAFPPLPPLPPLPDDPCDEDPPPPVGEDMCWLGTPTISGNDFTPSRTVWRGTRYNQTGTPTFTLLNSSSPVLGGWLWDRDLTPDQDHEGRNFMTWSLPTGTNRVRLRGTIVGNTFGSTQTDPNELPCDFSWQLWDAVWDPSVGPTSWEPGTMVAAGVIDRSAATGTSAGWELPFDVTWEPAAARLNGRAQFYLVCTSVEGRSRSTGLTFCSARGAQGGTLSGPSSSVQIPISSSGFEFSFCVDANGTGGALGSCLDYTESVGGSPSAGHPFIEDGQLTGYISDIAAGSSSNDGGQGKSWTVNPTTGQIDAMDFTVTGDADSVFPRPNGRWSHMVTVRAFTEFGTQQNVVQMIRNGSSYIIFGADQGGGLVVNLGTATDLGLTFSYSGNAFTVNRPAGGPITYNLDAPISYFTTGTDLIYNGSPTPASWPRISTFMELAVSGDCGDPCVGVSPGELADPITDPSPVTGEEPTRGITNPVTFDTVFHLDHQYQPGSTEVWVNGQRIRLGHDYTESAPHDKQITILSHIDIGGGDAFDPTAVIRVTYTIWTFSGQVPEEAP